MEEDDMDFTPLPKTSSNLASLFGFTKKPLQGNASLTYTAPKPPKKESSPAKKQSEEKTKGKIIFSKAVQGYKLENRTYVNQGLIGIVITGNHDSRIYEIILYKRTKEHLIQVKISSHFSITLSPNDYVSFFDDNKQNWSIMFQSPEDVEQFSLKVAICKFYSQSEPPVDILIQDLGPSLHQRTTSNSVVEIIYSSYTLIPEELTKLKGDIKEKIKLSNYSFTQLSKGLIGCAENCKRVIIFPHSLSGQWINELGPNKDLLMEVKIEKVVPEDSAVIDLKLPADGPPESPLDSSAEETSIKARGTSLKEALASTKSQKAKLISRMARMGQATLPVKQDGLSAGPSDSEEEVSAISSPKSRLPKIRSTTSNPSQNSTFSQNPETSQQLSLYQNDLTWKQAQLNKLGVAYQQQLIPISASPISSPSSDPSLSVYISESRIQAAELRMGMTKISEKLDLVWNKIQCMSGAGLENKSHHQVLMDSGGILASIQNLLTENEHLKKKTEEQKEKIEQQNDRIFNLLELNHKYLEQNSTSHEKQSATELKLKSEMELLQKKEVEIETANRVAADRVQNLESELAKSEKLNMELNKVIEELKVNAEAKRNFEERDEKAKELESLRERNAKASEMIIRLKERLREVVSENGKLMSVIESQKKELETGNLEMIDSKTKYEDYQKTVENLKRQISEEESKSESKIEGLSKVVAKLEDENKALMEKIESRKETILCLEKDNQGEIKNFVLKILSHLKGQFSKSEEYPCLQVLTVIENIFTGVINGTIKLDDDTKDLEPGSLDRKPTVLPAPRISLQDVKLDLKEEESNESEVKAKSEDPKGSSSKNPPKKEELEKKGTESQKRKDETEDRYKSYDQSWRTAKPPPPPLFDDDDEDDDWLN